MSEIRPIDANALKEVIETNFLLQSDQVDIVCKLINNAPTVELKRVKNELNNELNELKPERPQGDLISREALKETIELEEGIFWDSYSPNELVVRKKYIDNAPTVEPEITNEDLQFAMTESHKLGYEMAKAKFERPQGEWVLIKNSDGVLKCYECSECKKCQGYISNFCEDCGADMRKGGAE